MLSLDIAPLRNPPLFRQLAHDLSGVGSCNGKVKQDCEQKNCDSYAFHCGPLNKDSRKTYEADRNRPQDLRIAQETTRCDRADKRSHNSPGKNYEEFCAKYHVVRQGGRVGHEEVGSDKEGRPCNESRQKSESADQRFTHSNVWKAYIADKQCRLQPRMCRWQRP